MTFNKKEYNKEYYLENKEYHKEYHLKNREKRKEYYKEYYLKNREQKKKYYKEYSLKNREKNKEYQKEYRLKNREKRKEYNKEHYLKNKEYYKEYDLKNREKIKEQKKEYNLKNREKINRYKRKRSKIDPNFKLAQGLRTRMRAALKGKVKSKRTMELLGCTIDEAWNHLERKFTEGMTRENHGKWHVDHIMPCTSFDLTKPEQQEKCFHYTNLQPLWALDNIKKGNRVPIMATLCSK